jgi:hypothetical protein
VKLYIRAKALLIFYCFGCPGLKAGATVFIICNLEDGLLFRCPGLQALFINIFFHHPK